MTSLYHLAAEYAEALDVLSDPDIPAEAVSDTLEALQGEIAVKGANVAAYALNLEAEAEMIKAAEAKLKARRTALENKAQRIRDYLKDNMQRCGITKISALDHTFSVTLGKPRESVVIEDEADIPDDLCTFTRSASKTAIKAAIDGGQDVPGARIEHNATLTIK